MSILNLFIILVKCTVITSEHKQIYPLIKIVDFNFSLPQGIVCFYFTCDIISAMFC